MKPLCYRGAIYCIFLVILFNSVLIRIKEKYVYREADKSEGDRVMHLVFVGDSLTRYQYLSIAYKLFFGSHSVVPRKLVNKRLHSNWNEFYQYSTGIFGKHMFCDCYRTDSTSKSVPLINKLNKNGIGLSKRVRKKVVHKEYGVLNRIRENRYFHCDFEVGETLIHMNLTYIQFFGDKPSSHGRTLPEEIELSTIDSKLRSSKWAYGQLSDLLQLHIRLLHPSPTHIILSTGAHYHERMMPNLEDYLKVAISITPYVYWKQAPPLKTQLIEARKGGATNFSLPWDIDILAHSICKKLSCYFVSFPDILPYYLIHDSEYMIPEYFDETHFASPELYVFWSSYLFYSKHLRVLGSFIAEVNRK